MSENIAYASTVTIGNPGDGGLSVGVIYWVLDPTNTVVSGNAPATVAFNYGTSETEIRAALAAEIRILESNPWLAIVFMGVL